MRNTKLIIVVFLFSPMVSPYGLGQAAAEAAMTHGAAALEGTSAGTMVGRAAARLGEKVAPGRASATAHGTTSAVRARVGPEGKRPASRMPATPASGSMVVSVEGAAHEESPCRQLSRPASGGRSDIQAAGACKATADSYPSVVNLGPAR